MGEFTNIPMREDLQELGLQISENLLVDLNGNYRLAPEPIALLQQAGLIDVINESFKDFEPLFLADLHVIVQADREFSYSEIFNFSFTKYLDRNIELREGIKRSQRMDGANEPIEGMAFMYYIQIYVDAYK